MYAIAFCREGEPWLQCKVVVAFNSETRDILIERMEEGADFWTVQVSGFLSRYQDIAKFHERCKLLRKPT